MQSTTTIEILGTLFFACAILHTFLVQKIRQWGDRYHHDSILHGVFHFLGEIEVVFGLWAVVLMVVYSFLDSSKAAIAYLDSLAFTEPLFVFVIMVLASTKPVLFFAGRSIQWLSHLLQKVIPVKSQWMDMSVLLIFGPMAGSFITEPAAITVTALLLKEMLHLNSKKFIYALLAVLFVNISIGGALTPYAAPPILMVASKWGWDLSFTLLHFGWKSFAAVLTNSLLFVIYFRKEILEGVYTLQQVANRNKENSLPSSLVAVHLCFLAAVVFTAHYSNVFMGIFLLFLGVATITQKHQEPLRLKESLLVGYFLAGIIVFGPFQKWWLQPLLSSLADSTLFWSATLLTAVTDNAALTYLGTQVDGLSDASKYALVAGAISGGGLTIIANAPNAAGYSILNSKFPGGVFNPLGLLLAALIPTLIACFFLFLIPVLH